MLARKGRLFSKCFNQEQIAAILHFSTWYPIHILQCSVETAVKGRTPQVLRGSSSLPYEERQDSDLQFNSRFLLKAGKGRREKRKQSEDKNRLRCILMFWTKLSENFNFQFQFYKIESFNFEFYKIQSFNFTNKNIFLLS